MEVQLTAEQQAELARIADQTGRTPGELAREAVDRYLQDEAHFLEAVRAGQEAAGRSDFVESSEVWSNVDRALKA